MKTFASAFSAVLLSETAILATCWRLTRQDGAVLGFTDFDRPLTIEGVTYYPGDGFQASDIDRDLELQANQISLKSFFGTQITQTDAVTGKLNYGRVFVFRVDPFNIPSSLSASPPAFEPLISGSIGAVTLTDLGYQLELRGLEERLQTAQGWVTSETCRNQFCDPLCGLNIASYTLTVSVTAPIDRAGFTSSFSAPYNNYFLGGELRWTTGDNTGESSTVIYSNGANIRCFDRFSNPIQTGDQCTVERGCNKTFQTCREIYGNGVNFNGEPGLVGDDDLTGVVGE